MSVIRHTFTTQKPGSADTLPTGNREELSDVINKITPEETPMYTMIPKGSCKSMHPEWEVDELEKPGFNAVAEGQEYTFGGIKPVIRMGNYTQIFRKSIIISRSQEAVSNAGNAEKMKYQWAKRGVELRKDIEYALMASTGTNRGTGPGTAVVTTVPETVASGSVRLFGSVPSWIETNVNLGEGGGVRGYDPSTGLTTAPSPGRLRVLTRAHIDDVMQQMYEEGANVKFAIGSPAMKAEFSQLFMDNNTGIAEYRYAAKANTKRAMIATADIYEGPYGKLTVMPNRVMSFDREITDPSADVDATPGVGGVKGLKFAVASSGTYSIPAEVDTAADKTSGRTAWLAWELDTYGDNEATPSQSRLERYFQDAGAGRHNFSSFGLSHNLIFVDTSMLQFKWLRKIQRDNRIAMTGDHKKAVILGEGTLCVKNEKGLGMISDLRVNYGKDRRQSRIVGSDNTNSSQGSQGTRTDSAPGGYGNAAPRPTGAEADHR